MDAGDGVLDAAAFEVPREELLRNIHRFQARDRYCWALPLTLVGFALWCLGLSYHADIPAASQVETGLSKLLLVPGYTDGSATVATDTSSYYQYLRDQIMTPLVPDASGVVNRYGYLLGGVRVSQTRAVKQPGCKNTRYVDIVVSVIGDVSCHPMSTDDVSPFLPDDRSILTKDVNITGNVEYCLGSDGTEKLIGPEAGAAGSYDLTTACPDIVNATIIIKSDEEYIATLNVTSAFVPRPLSAILAGRQALATYRPQEMPNDAFSFTFDYYSSTAQEAVSLLEAAQWVDAATKDVHVHFGLVNPDLGYWARGMMTTTFTRGGGVLTTARVASLPIDPYEARPGIIALDVALCIYVAFQCLVTASLLLRKSRRGCKMWSEGRSAASTIASVVQPTVILELVTSVLLIATLSAWWQIIATLATIRREISALAWSPESVRDDTAISLAWIEAACSTVSLYKTLGVVALFFLGLKTLGQFTLQPKLAVTVDALARSFSAMGHFAVAFTIVLIFFGIWGHIYFGGQVDRWGTPGSSAWAIVAFSMYDYDLLGMESIDTVSARMHFGLFMFLVTNLLLWCFLGILFENYSNAQAEADSQPSALRDLVAGAEALPQRMQRLTSEIRTIVPKWLVCCRPASQLTSMRPSYTHETSLRKVAAYRVVELLEGDAYHDRESVALGDIATSIGRSLPEVVNFVARFLVLPLGLMAAAEAATREKSSTARPFASRAGNKKTSMRGVIGVSNPAAQLPGRDAFLEGETAVHVAGNVASADTDGLPRKVVRVSLRGSSHVDNSVDSLEGVSEGEDRISPFEAGEEEEPEAGQEGGPRRRESTSLSPPPLPPAETDSSRRLPAHAAASGQVAFEPVAPRRPQPPPPPRR